MTYEDYEAEIDFDPEIEMFHGVVVNRRDVISFYGKSLPELKKEFKRSVEIYLEFCAESSKT